MTDDVPNLSTEQNSGFLSWLFGKLGALFFRSLPDPVPIWESELIALPPMEEAPVIQQGIDDGKFHVVASEWTFKDLLWALDQYMTVARRSAVALYGHTQYLDRQGWSGFRRMTAHCVPDLDNAKGRHYEYANTIGWPSQGGFMFRGRTDVKSDTIPIQAAYFVRHLRLPWNVKGEEGVPYEFVFVWNDNDGKDPKLPLRCFVTLDRVSGKALPCEILEQRVQHVRLPPPKRKTMRNHRPGHVTTVTRQWRSFDELLHDDDRPDKSPIREIVPWILNMHAQRAFTPLVIVRDKWMRVSFGVPLEQAPSFFKDRGITIENNKGRRTPIVHWVKAHTKTRGDKQIATRLHLRGQRQFMWRGYQVSVVIPGLHAPMVFPEALGVQEYGKDEVVPPGMISLAVGAERIEEGLAGAHSPTLAQIRRTA